MCQPFDPAKFNFTKAAVSEVLFAFEPSEAPGPSAFSPAARAGQSPSGVLVNVSPIDYGHVLLCPRLLDRLPQQLDGAAVALALRYAREAGSPYVRVGYNSLGAYATINHLHFQVGGGKRAAGARGAGKGCTWREGPRLCGAAALAPRRNPPPP